MNIGERPVSRAQLQPVYTTYGTLNVQRAAVPRLVCADRFTYELARVTVRQDERPVERGSPHNATNPTNSIELSVTVAWRGVGREEATRPSHDRFPLSFFLSLVLPFFRLGPWGAPFLPFSSSLVFLDGATRGHVQTRVHTDVDFLWRVG